MTFSSLLMDKENFELMTFHDKDSKLHQPDLHHYPMNHYHHLASCDQDAYLPRMNFDRYFPNQAFLNVAAGEKRKHDLASDLMIYNHDSLFDQVSNQNPYLVHKKVLDTIHMEFALEDRYNSLGPSRHERVKIRRRRKPQSCEWKPESVYKCYVECKPGFFEKSDYQDNISQSSCFGKINMRIPRAWSRKPSELKRRKIEDTSLSSSPTDTHPAGIKREMSSEVRPLPQAALANEFQQGLDDVFLFDFLFG